MSNSIIPFDADNIPAYITRNKEASESTKRMLAGMEGREVASITRTNTGRLVIKIPGREPISANANGPLRRLPIIVVSANPNMPRSYYESNEIEDGAPPECASIDGKYPRKGVRNKQSATCALCKHAVWGSGKTGEGTRCQTQKHLVVRMPNNPMLFFMKLTPADMDKKEPSAFAMVTRGLRDQGFNLEDVVLNLGLNEKSKGSMNFCVWSFEPAGFVSQQVKQEIAEVLKTDEPDKVLGLDIAESDIPSEQEVEASKPRVTPQQAAQAVTPSAPQPTPQDMFAMDDKVETVDKPTDVFDLNASSKDVFDLNAGVPDPMPPRQQPEQSQQTSRKNVSDVLAQFADL